jgi:purine-binding chemotaxis protein CheW
LGERANAVLRKNLVGFEVDGVNYAVDILRVREIIRPLETLDIPSARGGLAGVADYRGHVIPVIDLRERFARPGRAASGPARAHQERWLVVGFTTHLAGLIVDRVLEVFGTDQPAARDVSHLTNPTAGILLRGAYHHRGGLVFVLDVDRLVSDASALVSTDAPAPKENDGGA